MSGEGARGNGQDWRGRSAEPAVSDAAPNAQVADGRPKTLPRARQNAAGAGGGPLTVPRSSFLVPPSFLIPVNLPVPVAVERGADGEPAAVEWRGRWLDVTAVIDRWRIDDEWWREEIARLYRRVVLADERVLTLFEDLISGRWYVQRYRLRAGAAPEAKRRAARKRR